MVVVIALVVTGCGPSEESASTSTDGSTTTAGSVATTLPEGPAESTTTASVTTTSSTPEPEAEPFLRDLGLAVVSQLTPREGAGPRPDLVWDPVPDASSYRVLVMDAEGNPWWSWSGDDTQVVLGGVETTADIGGPVAGSGVTWVVFAFDDDGHLTGVSPRREVHE